MTINTVLVGKITVNGTTHNAVFSGTRRQLANRLGNTIVAEPFVESSNPMLVSICLGGSIRKPEVHTFTVNESGVYCSNFIILPGQPE